MATPSFRVKAVYDYNSPHDDDLSFPNGQIITVTDEEDADWYYGEYQDQSGAKQQGLFPRNFVERYEPATPPRPSRQQRPKKDTEPSTTTATVAEAADQVHETPIHKTNVQSLPPSNSRVREETITAPDDDPTVTQATSPIATSDQPSTKASGGPPPTSSSKAAPPPVAEKPTIGSFRDRIAAFNKSTAPPVAPMKPGGLSQGSGSSFIKKPYVAPPPSRNAYVAPPREPPLQRVYRREEDPEVTARTLLNAEEPAITLPAPPATSTDETGEEQPKPTTLKERIALLQKQQLEQATRHADAPQKKEKPKRPTKKRMDSQTNSGASNMYHDEALGERLESADHIRGQQMESTDDEPRIRNRSSTRRSRSKDASPLATPTASREAFLSDPNDADQSGAADTEDGGDTSTERDDSDEKPRQRVPTLPYRTSAPAERPGPIHTEENEQASDEEDEEEDEEEEMDPEVKRKMEIRERMAKMSGGMGMAGMFGLPGGMAPMNTRKQKSSGSSAKERSSAEPTSTLDAQSSTSQPIMALPGMQRMRSPEQEEKQVEVSKEEEIAQRSTVQVREPDEMHEMEDMREEPLQESAHSEARTVPPFPQGDRPVPAPPPVSRAAAPPVPLDRPVPPPPPPPPSAEPRHMTLPVAETPMSPIPGSESDDEMSGHNNSLSINANAPSNDRPTSRDAPPPVPNRASLVPPPRPQVQRSRPSQHDEISSEAISNPPSPLVPGVNFRPGRVPPIPGASPSMSSPPQNRAPPPPVPGNASLSRAATGDKNILAASKAPVEETEEVTEYEGDYDTDIAPGATHKEALKSHSRDTAAEEPLTIEETSYHHQGLPSLGPPPGPAPIPTGNAHRAVPPPPPNQPPRHNRKSSDMPRAAPPPPPPREQKLSEDDGDYDPYSYVPQQGISASGGVKNPTFVDTSGSIDEYDDMYDASPVKQHAASPPTQAAKTFANPPIMPPQMPRQSLDILRAPSTRRSMDAPRPSVDQAFIADDVDLGRSSQWWVQRKMPPPVFQNRPDVSFEVEESGVIQQGGGQSTVKHVYVLFLDYSQTVITAQFDVTDSSKVDLQQRHEPPPSRPRQDQLEDAHVKFGLRIAEMANTKVNSVVGDSSPFTFISDLIGHLQSALPPVGTRAYGALVYTNLANASVLQNDEIRAGDIISFRNAKMQGHRGPMKQKYNIEVGKPDHVAVVVDWDGTKKKVRAWEQGRESKKVKIESFKLGDLKSGEVKVWRVMSREWVGWGGGNA